jgi:hypothetical protein
MKGCRRHAVVAAAALVALIACSRAPDAERRAGSGSPPAAFDPALLDAALAARKLEPAAVVKRITTPTAGWAVVAARPDPMDKPTEYLVLRVRAADTAELRITPPRARQPASFDGVDALEARDLDGRGSEAAILTVRWNRTVQEAFPRECAGCFQRTDEEATQLYVIGGKARLQVGFTHLLSYKTSSLSMPEDNALPVPADEEVTYRYRIGGPPPGVAIQRTKHEVSTRRVKGALDPAADPLLGGDRDAPVTLE